MSSPSDDGQCTDSDHEEGVISEVRGEAASPSHSNRDDDENRERSARTASESGSDHLVEIERDSDTGSLLSDAEDEEARLRQKLLEKRGAIKSETILTGDVRMQLTSAGTQSTSENETKVLKQSLSVSSKEEKDSDGAMKDNHQEEAFRSTKAADISIAEDEEMFSVQPKKVLNPRLFAHTSRSLKEHGRNHGDKVRKRERSRDEKHRHKDRKRERRPHAEHKKELLTHEERKRYLKHQSNRERGFPRLSGRVEYSEAKASAKASFEKLHKERESHNAGKIGRLSLEENVAKIRSPRKRENELSPKHRQEIPAKKVYTEKHRETKSELTVTVGKLGNEKERRVAITTAGTTKEEAVAVKSEPSSPQNQAGNQKTESPESEKKSSPIGPQKYSKFDSDSDDNERFEGAAVDDGSGQGLEALEEDSDPESDDIILRGSEDDVMDYLEDIDEEELALLTPETRARVEAEQQRRLISKLPVYYPGIHGCRNVAEFECLNRIEEGTFGVVYRAKEKRTDEIVALKRLKMEKEKEGFPITALREINMLLKAGKHPNIVNVREIVVGSSMDKIYLVMEYVEHDMKTLMDAMHGRQKHFTIGQVKTLMQQLLSGVKHLHDEWILHRDLKTSNLLLSHQGILKIGDFGLSREYGDPLKPYTPIVVTLWYRSPELLLGVKEYSTEVDMWSCGCIFAEFLKLKPLFPGKGEADQINRIFTKLGTPSDIIWPGYSGLPGPRKMKFEQHEPGQLEKDFPSTVIDKDGLQFIKLLLRYDPQRRLSAADALKNGWFSQHPPPTPPALFPTWPAKSELGKLTKSPVTKSQNPTNEQKEKLYRQLKVEPKKEPVGGFALKFDVAPKSYH